MGGKTESPVMGGKSAAVEPSTKGAPGRGRGRRPRPAAAAASSSKRKASNEDPADEDEPAGPITRKKARAATPEGILPRSEAAELIGLVVMELEATRMSLEKVRELMATFAAHANGTKHVVIKAPNDSP
jgi:hypothetical protein